MWLLFVRNGGCGEGRKERKERTGSQRSAVEMQPLWPMDKHIYVCLEERKCVCRVREGEKGAEGEGHNALGERDEICGVRW